MPRRGSTARLGMPLGVSAAVHVAILAFALVVQSDPPPPLPPVYRVSLAAAPPGPRQAGVVRPPSAATPTPAPQPAQSEAPPPPAPERAAREMAPPEATPIPTRRPQTQATPNPTPTRPRETGAGKAAETPPAETKAGRPEAPTAGSGPQGGRGTDVVGVNTAGIEFPFPGYLNNVVRQIYVRFQAPDPNARLSAQVFFLIRRDGSIDALRVTRRSGNFNFDTEAVGAVEAAGRAGAFGALPDGFTDDVLPVYFNFDPDIIR